MNNWSSFRAPLHVGFAVFVGLVILAGCEAQDSTEADLLARAGLGFTVDNGFEGVFVTRIADMLDGTSRTSHHLVAADDQGPEVEIVLEPGFEIPRGARVRAHGDFVEEGVLEVDQFEILALPPQPLIDPEVRTPRRLAVIIVHWETAGLQNGEAKSSMFENDRSTNVFYQENSYGKEKMVGDVFGPYQIPDPGGCNPGLIADSAIAAFEEKGHKRSDFRQFMYHFPSTAGCGFGGLANVGSPNDPARDSWYNGSFGCVVRNQEIGHNYGMGHSRSYACVDAEGQATPFSAECSFEEYGDPYDPMGGGCGHMNVVQKTYMDWLEGCNVVTATADGTFNLLPTELPCDGTQALRFPAFDGRYYWLEYRRAIGKFDGTSGFEGVLVHVAGEVGGGGPTPYILDMGPSDFLHEGDSYTDPEGTVTFTVVAEGETHAVISATFPEGGSGEPTCLDDAGSPTEEAGGIGVLTCAEAPIALDTEPPTIELTYPLDGDMFEPGASFKITAEAADDRGVSELILYVDGEPLFRSYEEPWEWQVNGIPEGDYEFGVVAKDGPNWTPSNAVVVHVTNEVPGASDSGTDDAGQEDTGSTGGTTGPIEPDTDSATDTEGPGAADGGGCGCRSTGSGGLGFAWLGLGAIMLRRRRR